MNYKKYVGGKWEKIGKGQFDFAMKVGLKPYHKFLDIGCGSLRGGRFFIDYLDTSNYYGIDHNKWLIDAGTKYELKSEDKQKKPIFLVNRDFNFSLFRTNFDFVFASSLFTHLTKDKIKQCIKNLYLVTLPNVIFYASIFNGDSSKNLAKSHDNKRFRYSIDEIRQLSDKWKVEFSCYKYYSGQTMLKFTKV